MSYIVSELRTGFHGAGLAFMYYGLASLDTLDADQFISKQYGGHSQFLTIQGLVISCVVIFLAIISDFVPNLAAVQCTKKFLLLISLPLSAVISTVYWSLRLFLPALILPTAGQFQDSTSSDESPGDDPGRLFYIPLPMDLAMHAAPGIILTIHFFLFEKKFTRSEVTKTASASLIAFTLYYGAWIEWCSTHNNGKFPYPFLPEDSLNARIAIYTGASIFAYVSLRGLNMLHS